jgi:hypothetical protein
MKIKMCDAPVYLHSMGGSVHVDIEHPIFASVINNGERTFCQGKGEHGIFITLDPEMSERASDVMRTRGVVGGTMPVLLQAEVSAQLNEIANLLEVLGDEFRPRAYRRAAHSIEATGADLVKLSDSDDLTRIPGVGRSIAKIVKEYLETGKISSTWGRSAPRYRPSPIS